MAAALLVALLAGCGDAPGTGGAPPETETPAPDPTVRETATAGPEITGTGMEGPPPFRLRYDGHELVLRPHAWCYGSGCVDGVAQDPPDIGRPEVVEVFVPVRAWDLEAIFQPAGDRCGRYQTLMPTRDGQWFTLRPAGHPGRYRVSLFANGGGDMIADLVWRTPVEGELPVPESRMSLIAEHDGRPDSYGLEIAVDNLAETPEEARARIAVESADGRSLTFDAVRSGDDCRPEGSIYFDGPDARGHEAANLGGFPFHYTVDLILDGKTYRATADYPADEIEGNEPSVALEFTPALPRME